MLKEIITAEIDSHQVSFKRVTQCPMCGSGIGTAPKHEYLIEYDVMRHSLYTVNECEVCRKPFVAVYDPICLSNSEIFTEHHCIPKAVTQTKFADEIYKISPSFPIIYNESEAAEQYDLLQIAGPGYRRALEFLVKDYLIYLFPDRSEDFKRIPLGQAVNEIPNLNERIASLNATWIGNSETHYVKEFVDKDISDLKKYILALVYWICMSELSSHLLKK